MILESRVWLIYIMVVQKKQKMGVMKKQILRDLSNNTFFANFVVTFAAVTMILLNSV